ncbi:DUF429 domain-containing protein, partial [Streptococcus pseudopneumoniae]|nr:DUF429 domain-containing protein [Streptococcus pseudopneumoniae]
MKPVAAMELWGVDFTSAPSTRKPITIARGGLRGNALELQAIDALTSFDAFEARLRKGEG